MNKTPVEVQHDPASRTALIGLSRIAMALRSKAWKDASHRGLTPTQGQILAFLSTREDARLTDVAKALAISAPTASDAVATLERKGLLRKQASRTDPRAISLRLTASGKREVQRSSSNQNFLQRAIDELSRSEQEALLVLLVKILRSLQATGDVDNLSMCLTCLHFQAYQKNSDAGHHCASYKIEFGNSLLRLECPQYRRASEDRMKAIWETFSNGLVVIR
jgi:DNA-binding MarR family transcriptional regulator